MMKETSDNKKNLFHRIPWKSLREVIAQARFQHWPELILGFLVLCRFLDWNKPYTTAGANSISKHLGISRSRANQIIQTLLRDKIIFTSEDWQAMSFDPEADATPEKHNGFQSLVIPEDLLNEYLKLPTFFFTGRGKGTSQPPIRRLHLIYPKQVQLDGIILLLNLYAHYDLELFGGCDPGNTIFSRWLTNGEWGNGAGTFGYFGEKQDDDGLTWFFSLVGQKDRNLTTSATFLKLVTEGHENRFWDAFQSLHHHNFIFEIAYVFSDDPIKKSDAEPLYPLWIFDRHMRQQAKEKDSGLGGLYADTLNCTARSRIMDQHYEDWKKTIFNGESPSDMFSVATNSGHACVVSIIRPRYFAITHDNTHGYAFDSNRIRYWQHRLRGAFTTNL